MPQLTTARLLLLAVLTGTIFLASLGSSQLWDRDEPRNARAAVEMLSRGDWTVPTFNGELRVHKPVLLYWGQMLSYLSLGQSEFSARLPSALAAMLSVFCIAVLSSRLSGTSRGINTTGFWSAAALATCMLMVMAGRAATPDALLIATTTLGTTILVIASLAPAAPFSSGHVRAASWVPAAAAYTCFGFAVLAKGPVGIVLPLAVVHLWWMIIRRLESIPPTTTQVSSSQPTLTVVERLIKLSKTLITESWYCFNPMNCWRATWALRTIPGVVLAILVAAPWYTAVGIETNGAFLRGFFIDHNLGRALNSMEGHHGTIAFYPAAFLAGIFPWSLWLIPIALWSYRAYRENVVQRQLVVLGAVWIYVYVGGFSLASTKLPSYITPCYPGAALIIGSYLKQFEGVWNMPKRSWRLAANSLAIVVGVLISVGIVIASQVEHMPLVAFACGGGIALALAGVVGLSFERFQRPQWIPMAWLLAASAFHVNLFAFGAQQAGQYRFDTTLIQTVQEEFPSEHWMSVGAVEPSYVYYRGGLIKEIRQPAVQLDWQQVAAQFERFPDSRLILIGEHINTYEARANGYQDLMPPLQELGRCKRFLKTGEVAVYRLSPQSNPARIAEQPTSPVTR